MVLGKIVKVITFALTFLLPIWGYPQVKVIDNIHFEDVENFWVAYDSIQSTSDRKKQVEHINNLYIDKASEGLRAFLKNKQDADLRWVDNISKDPSFWNNLRQRTLFVRKKIDSLQMSIDELKSLYPLLSDAATYFIIGFRQQGGTVRGNLSIIGAEVILAANDSNFEELKRIVVHEYVHTQQKKPSDFRNFNVLGASIREGACDFISELVLKQTLALTYIDYGLKNELDIWRIFAQDMYTSANDLWVSTGDNPMLPCRDLGYYIGYVICKSYYQNSVDSSEAVKEIISIDYADTSKVIAFFKKSKYLDYIISKGYNQEQKLPIEGYRTKSSQIEFHFTPDKDFWVLKDGKISLFSKDKETIQTVSIAGDFNNWNYEHSPIQLTKDKCGLFVVSVDRIKIGETGSRVNFKFIVNNKYWILPSFAISNRVFDSHGNVNLFIDL